MKFNYKKLKFVDIRIITDKGLIAVIDSISIQVKKIQSAYEECVKYDY